ncbi:MAG TPA: hypothetical protein VGK22_02635 [Candidatus Angelobacter sp.]|jgi:hypothetical protein
MMVFPPHVNLSSAGLATLKLIAIANAIDSIEIFSAWRQYSYHGLFDERFNPRSTMFRPGKLAIPWLIYPRLLVFPLVVLICAVVLLFVPWTNPAPWLACMATARMLLRWQGGRGGGEGADRILSILLLCMTCFYLVPIMFVQRDLLIFIAALSILAYTTSGMAKILNPEWRTGRILAPVLSLEIFANPLLARKFRKHWRAAQIASWLVLLYECGCPIWVLTSPVGCCVFILMGIGFHLFNAATHGLNLFFWVYLATYPSLLFAVERLYGR